MWKTNTQSEVIENIIARDYTNVRATKKKNKVYHPSNIMS